LRARSRRRVSRLASAFARASAARVAPARAFRRSRGALSPRRRFAARSSFALGLLVGLAARFFRGVLRRALRNLPLCPFLGLALRASLGFGARLRGGLGLGPRFGLRPALRIGLLPRARLRDLAGDVLELGLGLRAHLGLVRRLAHQGREVEIHVLLDDRDLRGRRDARRGGDELPHESVLRQLAERVEELRFGVLVELLVQSPTVALPSTWESTLRKSRGSRLVLPVTSIRPLAVLVRTVLLSMRY
jgi:hypothetical protein